jgi:hypothetical protein
MVGEILTPDGKANTYESKLIELDGEYECDVEIIKGLDECNEKREILLHSPERKRGSQSFLELVWIVLFDYFQRRAK